MRDKTCRAFDTLSASDVYLTADVHTAVPSLTYSADTNSTLITNMGNLKLLPSF